MALRSAEDPGACDSGDRCGIVQVLPTCLHEIPENLPGSPLETDRVVIQIFTMAENLFKPLEICCSCDRSGLRGLGKATR